MKSWAPIVLVLPFVLGSCECGGTKSFRDSGRTVKIGILAPFSGPDSTKGVEGLKGMETAMRLQPCLQNGDRVTLVKIDDRNDPRSTLECLRKLVEEEKVTAVITFSGSDPVLTMAETADVYRTPILAALATHPDITENNRFVSQLCFDDRVQGTIAALFVRDELLIDRAALFIDPASAYSTYLASAFEAKFRAIGGEVTDRVSLTEETGDLSDLVERLRANDPELLYLTIRPRDVIRIAEELERQDWRPRMMGRDGLTATLLEQHKEALDLVSGMLSTDFFADDMPLTPFGEQARHEGKGLRTAYAALGVEGYALLVDAMNRCGDPQNRECITSQIRSTTHFTGVAGKITIRADGKAERPLSISSILAGRSHFIARVY